MKRKHFSVNSGNSASEHPSTKQPINTPVREPAAPVSAGPPWPAWKGNPATRCVAYKKSGEQCRRQSRRGTTVCDWHGAKAPQVKRKARQRIEEAQDILARELLNMALDDSITDATKLGAIKHALAIGGLTEKTAVEVEVGPMKPWERIVSGIRAVRFEPREKYLARHGLPPIERKPDDEPIDAEVVDDPGRGADLAADERTPRKRPTPRPEREPSPTVPAEQYLTGMAAIEEAARANRAAGVYGKKRRR